MTQMNTQQVLINRMLPTRAHNALRRNLKVEKSNKSCYQKSFPYKAAKYWNSMPTAVHCITDKEKLKFELKKRLTDKGVKN